MYELAYKVRMKDGEELSDSLGFQNRKEALEVIELEKSGYGNLDYDNIEELFYWDQETGECWTII